MKRLTGLKKELAFVNNAKNKEFKKLPFKILWYLHSTFKNEKLTQINGRYVINTFMPPFPSTAFEQLIKNTVSVYNHNVFPYSAYAAVTARCGFNCWHCSKAYRHGEELSTDKWIQIMRRLQDIGISVIGFTGGEPLLMHGLEDIINSIDERSTTILFTSGDGLTDQRAKSLKGAGLFYIAVSLDHYDEGKHNKLRGSDKAFSTALEAIDNSLKNGFYTAVQITVTTDILNNEDMNKYIEFVNKLGVEEIRIVEPMPTGRLIKEGADVFLNESEHEFINRYHIATNKNKRLPKIASFTFLENEALYGCGAGIQHIYIDPFGNLCPCDFTPLSFGNINEEGFDIPYQRLRSQFNRPRDKCFILDNMGKISPLFEKNLPLGYEESLAVCSNCTKGRLPEFYKKLGWE
ncbi:MAG: radical SAM protein [Candidatus Omnitrophota bacterium]